MTRSITGNCTLTSSDLNRSGAACSGRGRDSDFGPGMDVLITDQGGMIIGRTQTVPGPEPSGAFADYAGMMCIVSFSVAQLPDVPVYRIDVGSRGTLRYSKADLESDA